MYTRCQSQNLDYFSLWHLLSPFAVVFYYNCCVGVCEFSNSCIFGLILLFARQYKCEEFEQVKSKIGNEKSLGNIFWNFMSAHTHIHKHTQTHTHAHTLVSNTNAAIVTQTCNLVEEELDCFCLPAGLMLYESKIKTNGDNDLWHSLRQQWNETWFPIKTRGVTQYENAAVRFFWCP